MADMEGSKVWIEGRVVDGEEARISVFDHGFLYGDGLFEGIRVYGGGLFRLNDHLQRFEAGAKALGIALPGGLRRVEEVVLEAARAYGQQEGYVRLILTRGRGALGVDPSTCEEPQLICIVKAVSLYPAAKLDSGIDLVTVSVRRPAPDALDPAVKSLNYLNSVLAKREARLRGADEALLLNAHGTVAEVSVANLFIVSEGSLGYAQCHGWCTAGNHAGEHSELGSRVGDIPFQERSVGSARAFFGRRNISHRDGCTYCSGRSNLMGPRWASPAGDP